MVAMAAYNGMRRHPCSRRPLLRGGWWRRRQRGGIEQNISKCGNIEEVIRYRPSHISASATMSESYHVEVAETGCYRNSSHIGERTQRPVGGSSPRRASQHGYAEPDHSSASRG